jgi:alkylation response protein AidB-like acyl-CoA dehydrogenase
MRTMSLDTEVSDVAFGPVIAEARRGADEGEAGRTLGPGVVAAAKDSGLFCMALPRALGGLEVAPAGMVDVLERLAHADGAAGWCGFIGNATSLFGWLEPPVARELLAGAPRVASASVWAPWGRAVPDGRGGYVVDGRWTTASGCRHSEWAQLGVLVMDGDRPRSRPDGSPDWRFAYLPAGDLEVLDNWDTLGLQGTGSHDVVVRSVAVPAEHLAMPMLDEPTFDDPLFRLGFWGISSVLMSPFPLGVARRALDELEAFLPGRFVPPGAVPPAEDPQVHYELGRARAQLAAARAYLDDVTGRAWARATSGSPCDDGHHRDLGLAMQQAMTVGLQVVDTAYRFAGSAAIRRDNVIQRCFRDLHTGVKHIAYGLDGYRGAGRHALGLP